MAVTITYQPMTTILGSTDISGMGGQIYTINSVSLPMWNYIVAKGTVVLRSDGSTPVANAGVEIYNKITDTSDVVTRTSVGVVFTDSSGVFKISLPLLVLNTSTQKKNEYEFDVDSSYQVVS